MKQKNNNKNKKLKKKTTAEKPRVVTRKFLTDLANRIYNTKTRKFMRLCEGTLQNGPDPSDDQRTMHCGLGELYYAMTGRQPDDDEVSESGVIQKAIELARLDSLDDKIAKKIKALQLDAKLEEYLIDATVQHIDDIEYDVRKLLNYIPDANDHASDYRTRSQRVANQLRRIAELLPDDNH